MKRQAELAVVDFGRMMSVPGCVVLVVILGVEVSQSTATVFLGLETLVLLLSTLGVHLWPSLRGRAFALVAGFMSLSILGLMHFGPMLGIGLFYMASTLLTMFFYGPRGTVFVGTLLSLSILVPPIAGISPPNMSLEASDWVRVMTTTVFALLLASFVFHRLYEAFAFAVSVDAEAGAREQALEQERRELFEAAMQAQRLESLGRLSGEVAHEFNNALVLVRGGVDLLETEVDAEGREILEMMSAGLDQATRTAESLLAFARQGGGGAGQSNVRRAVLDVAGRLGSLVPRGTTITVGEVADAEVPLSAEALGEILLNLILNAADAMPDGGEVHISATVVTGHVRMIVTDEGTGMSPEEVGRVFEPFYTTKSEDGTGLGLAVVWGHVTRAGGAIEVESERGRGTTLTIDLPLLFSEVG